VRNPCQSLEPEKIQTKDPKTPGFSNRYRPFEAANYFKETCPKHPNESDKIELAAKQGIGRLSHPERAAN
jgi:hypothetical protein